jgi:hypothetical protein
VLDNKSEATEVRVNVALERDPAMTLSLRDRTGRPVAGTWMHGLSAARFISALWYESAEVEVYGVEKDKPRVVTFFEPKNKITGSVTLKGDEKQPVVVTLGPPGILKGRLLNPDGTPSVGVTVSALYPDHGTSVVFKQAQEPDGCVITDKNGVFRFDRMILGHKFSLMYSLASPEAQLG